MVIDLGTKLILEYYFINNVETLSFVAPLAYIKIFTGMTLNLDMANTTKLNF